MSPTAHNHKARDIATTTVRREIDRADVITFAAGQAAARGRSRAAAGHRAAWRVPVWPDADQPHPGHGVPQRRTDGGLGADPAPAERVGGAAPADVESVAGPVRQHLLLLGPLPAHRRVLG